MPLFGLGQSLIPASDVGRRRYAFWLMGVYVASGLGLLLTTSFLNLRRYLRQRNLQMPVAMTGVWLTGGALIIAVLLTLGALIPRPSPEYALLDLSILAGTKERDGSRNAQGKGWAKNKGDVAEGTRPAPRRAIILRQSRQASRSKNAGNVASDDAKGKKVDKGAGDGRGKGEGEGRGDAAKGDDQQGQDEGDQDEAAQEPPSDPPPTGPLPEVGSFLASLLKWVVLRANCPGDRLSRGTASRCGSWPISPIGRNGCSTRSRDSGAVF